MEKKRFWGSAKKTLPPQNDGVNQGTIEKPLFSK